MEFDKKFLNDDEFKNRTNLALNWVKKSIEVTGTPGSSAYFSRRKLILKGWQKPYPETTGYLIETLYDYANYFEEKQYTEIARKAADWICSLQFEDGSLPGSYLGSQKPSIFNTGQMLFGLIRAYQEDGNQYHLTVLKKAVTWLIDSLSEDGSWKNAAFVDGFIPSYYTRVIWSVLLSEKILKDERIVPSMKKALEYYREKINENGTVTDWSFKADEAAFTHTIAYTIRGFIESALIINDNSLVDKMIVPIEKIMKLRELKGKIAGEYDLNWRGNYKYICLTGNFQLALIMTRLYKVQNDIRYLNSALKLFEDGYIHQKLIGKNTKGAIAGSYPFGGNYLEYSYPNWAVKFYLDAYLALKTAVDELGRNSSNE